MHFTLNIILVFVMYKKPSISKTFLFFDLLFDLPKRCLPQLISQEFLWNLITTKVLWHFTLYHFSFWPSFITSILYVSLNAVLMAVVYELPMEENFIISYASNLLFVVFALFFIYISIKQAGLLYV